MVYFHYNEYTYICLKILKLYQWIYIDIKNRFYGIVP